MAYNSTYQTTLPVQLQNFVNGLSCMVSSYQDCASYTVGGVKAIFLCKFSTQTTAFIDSDGLIIGFDNPLLTEFVYLPFNRYSGNVITPLAYDKTGVNFTTTLSFKQAVLSAEHRKIFLAAIRARMGCIVLDENGRYWYLTENYPLRIVSEEFNTGSFGSDFNGQTLSFNVTDIYPPREVSAEAAATLVFDLGQNCSQFVGIPTMQLVPLPTVANCDLFLFNLNNL